MKYTFISILFLCILIIVCIFLPFIPGSYDGLSLTLSFMAQAFSFISLILVPTSG